MHAVIKQYRFRPLQFQFKTSISALLRICTVHITNMLCATVSTLVDLVPHTLQTLGLAVRR